MLIRLSYDIEFNIPQSVAVVAMTTSFGMAKLAKFTVVTDEVREAALSQDFRSHAAGSGDF